MKQMKKVLIAYRLKPEGLRALEGKYAVTLPVEKSYFSREEVLAMIPDYEVLVPNFSFYTDKEIMDRGTKLELISNWGVGFNNIDVDYATQKGVVVTNIPNSTREPTAEFTFGLLLAAARRIGYYDRKLRTPEGVSWGVYADAGLPVYGKMLGIIGMGRIGQSLARRAVASGMNIIYHNRSRLSKEIEERYNAKYVSFEELLSTADYISLNAPSTPETYRMIGEKQLNMMKPTAVFINTARGDMVDERALAQALKEKRIWAAALDVFEHEPRILPELLTLDNVLLAPHAGTKTMEDRINMSIEMAQNIVGFYESTYPVSRVN
jgi:lactate dehydrogenase-like 2-hydroxyacid dehydrogenase